MLTKKYGILIALPLASLIFVLVHILPKFMSGSIEPLYFLSIFPIALTLGYIFYATKSLWACVAFHALEDFFSLFVFGDSTSGAPALFFVTAPKELIVSGVKLGNWGDMVGLIIGSIVFLAVVAYFRYKSNKNDHTAVSTV